MTNVLKYKGYIGSIEYTPEDGVLFGSVAGVVPTLNYEGNTIKELENDFKETVDFYLQMCEEDGIEPIKPDTDAEESLTLFISASLYEKALKYVEANNQTLNSFVENIIAEKVSATV